MNRGLIMLISFPILWMTISIACATEKMNFVFVIVDDLRPALGCYGDNKAHTPNIDELAEQSIVFNKAYAQQALCAPSRNSLLTSRRPDTLGLYDFYSYWRNTSGNFTTLPQHLKNNGYTTASFGKVFHPGPSSNGIDDMPYSWSQPAFHPATEIYKDAPVCPGNHSERASNLICPVRVHSMPKGTLPDIETLKAAIEFLKYKRHGPFFIAVGFQKPHIPLKYPKKYLKFHPLNKFSIPKNYKWPTNISSVAYNPWMDLRRRSDIEKLKLKCPWQRIPKNYARKIIQSYYAAVTYVDDLVGELFDELKSLKIQNNTIIIFTSDHGWSLGEHGTWAKYSNFEITLRVPLLISIPGLTFHSKNNFESLNRKIVDNPVELLDIFPTVSELAGFPIESCPLQTTIDLCSEGSSLVSLIKSSLSFQSTSWKNAAISQYPRPGMKTKCRSSFDEPTLQRIKIMGYTLRTVRYRYTAWLNFSHETKKPNWREILAEELYDHNLDNEENSNLADSNNFKQIKIYLMNALMMKYSLL